MRKIKWSGVLAALLLTGSLWAAPVFRADWQEWRGPNRTVDGGTARFAAPAGSLSVRAELPNLAVQPNRRLRFEWRYQSPTPIRYIAFSFLFQGTQTGSAFLYFKETNAAAPAAGYLPDRWYTVDVPLTALRVHGGKALGEGDRLTGLRFWVAAEKGKDENALELRNFEVVEPDGAIAGDVYRPDFKTWTGAGKTATADGVAFTATGKGVALAAKLPEIEVKKSLRLQFEWQYQSKTPVRYLAFSFGFKGSQKGPAFLFFKEANAATPDAGFQPGHWYTVDVPLTALRVHGGKALGEGDRLTSLNFWIAAAPGEVGENTLRIRNFKIGAGTETTAAAVAPEVPLAGLPFRVWPRQTPVAWPGGLTQFVFLELPNPQSDANFTLRVTLPENCRVTGFPKGKSLGLTPGKITAVPLKEAFSGNTATLELAGKDFGTVPYRWLTLAVEVPDRPGSGKIVLQYEAGGRVLRTAELPVRIYPKLRGSRLPAGISVAAYAYPGLEKDFVPVFLGMFRAAGVNAIYNMNGERPGVFTLSDLAKSYGMELGLVFFIHEIQNRFKAKPLPGAKSSPDSLESMLDHPDELKRMIQVFLDENIGGKPYRCFTYDAEFGGLRDGKITGDTSPRALENFRRWAKLPENTVLTPDTVREQFSREWVAFICEQSNRFARIFREVLDESYPEAHFEAYSGYEFDDGAMKDRTRERYGTDWKTMSAAGIDYATAGYHGSMEQIRHTRDAVKGKALYLPAESYVENFQTPVIIKRDADAWSIRLISSFMNGSRHGLRLWYANDMDGNALIAVDRLTHFISLLGDFAIKGKDDPEAVAVRPAAEAENVYVLRRGGNAVIVCLNDSDVEKTLRLTLKGFRITGYTGKLSITDLADGKTLPAAKVLTVKVAPWGYRLLQLMDDGN